MDDLPNRYWRCHLCPAHAPEFATKAEAERQLAEHLATHEPSDL